MHASLETASRDGPPYKSLARLAPNTLGGRVGRDELGILCLEFLQLPHQLIKFLVADRGLIENVIQVFVMTDFFAEGFDLLFGVFNSGHRADYSRGEREHRIGVIWIWVVYHENS